MRLVTNTGVHGSMFISDDLLQSPSPTPTPTRWCPWTAAPRAHTVIRLCANNKNEALIIIMVQWPGCRQPCGLSSIGGGLTTVHDSDVHEVDQWEDANTRQKKRTKGVKDEKCWRFIVTNLRHEDDTSLMTICIVTIYTKQHPTLQDMDAQPGASLEINWLIDYTYVQLERRR